MNEKFHIYIDRLKDGREEEIEASFDPAFLNLTERDLQFIDPVKVSGVAYTTSDHMILRLDIETYANMPCSICNKMMKVKIEIPCFQHIEEIADIKSHIFDYSDILRENILVLCPQFAECEDNCPQRAELAGFLKKNPAAVKESSSKETDYFPFANL